MSEIIRDDTFYHCTEKNVRGVLCRVTLSSSELLITETDSHKERKIIIEDIIGCLCMKNPEVNKNRSTNSDTDSVFICIYFYSLGKNFKNTLYRKRETALLRCCKYSSFVENCDLISKWQNNIQLLIHEDSILHSSTQPTISDYKLESPRLLIFVNPNSGPGAAVKSFNTRVRSFLGEANISYDLVVTDHVGHCQEVVQKQDFSKYIGIIAVSGDGLLYEIYNGLMARDDWETVCKFPVGAIPQGSGNGLARSLAHFKNEPYLYDPLVVSALNIVKLKTHEMDLCLVNTSIHPKLCSFLSIGWGLLADIDIESERLRMIGEARFTVWALARVMRLRTYKATLSYLPFECDVAANEFRDLPPLSEPLPDSDRWKIETGEFVCVYSSMVPFIGTDLYFAPKSLLDDGIIWLMIVKAPVSKMQITQLLLSLDNGSHVQLPWVTFIPVTAFRLVPENVGIQSYLAIDGEKMDSQPVQAQIMPRKGRIFMR